MLAYEEHRNTWSGTIRGHTVEVSGRAFMHEFGRRASEELGMAVEHLYTIARDEYVKRKVALARDAEFWVSQTKHHRRYCPACEEQAASTFPLPSRGEGEGEGSMTPKAPSPSEEGEGAY